VLISAVLLSNPTTPLHIFQSVSAVIQEIRNVSTKSPRTQPALTLNLLTLSLLYQNINNPCNLKGQKE